MKTLSTPHTKRIISFSLILILLLYSNACHYYKVRSAQPNEIPSISKIGKIHKQFYINTVSDVYSISSFKLDSVSISGILTRPAKKPYYNNLNGYRYKEAETDILNEVHIYLNTDDVSQFMINRSSPSLNYLGNAVIPLSSILEIKIIEKDTGKTTASYFFGTVGVISGVLIIITVIVALTKSSCPYIYSCDGEGYVFDGEIFGGAIAKNLQREDYMLLPSLKPTDGLYKIRVCNELKERQYTDLAQLLVVEHPADQKVLLDKKGVAHSIGNIQPPVSAITFSGDDLLSAMESTDQKVFFFNDEEYSTNGVALKFNKPAGANMGKLVLRAKNTLWFDYQVGNFFQLFGNSFDGWMQKQSEINPDDRRQRIIDQQFPLEFYLKNDTEWNLVDRIETVGPLAYRDIVVPIDLTKHTTSEIELKIQSGFMFWEVDQIGMDFKNDNELEIFRVNPISANGTGDLDWLAELNDIDGKYMSQATVGMVTELVYRAPSASDKGYVQTCFLYTSGYYEPIREFEGLPQLLELYRFKAPGYFSDFSRTNYLIAIEKEAALASVKTFE